MYLTKITLNARHKQARIDSQNTYDFHRTLRKQFNGELTDTNGNPKQRVLFFLDTEKAEALVQSETALPFADKLPEGYAQQLWENKPFAPILRNGQLLRFRLLANPTKSLSNGQGNKPKRLPLWTPREKLSPEEKFQAEMKDRTSWKDWLDRKGEQGGFRVLDVQMQNNTLKATQSKNGNHNKTIHLAIFFEGVLQIETPDLFLETLKQGIGASKGFGFGMMQIAPLH